VTVRVGVKVNAPITDIRWSQLRDMARAADQSGLDSVWSEDHQFGPRLFSWGRGGGDPWEAWSVLAAIAAVTERVRLGTIVASLNMTGPVMFARKAAAVQEISGGRLVAGIGAGSLAVEYAKIGQPIDHPVSRFEEAFEIIRRLFAGERFSFHGTYHRLEDTWLATVPETPPEWMLGSDGPRMLELALPHVDGWNVHWSQMAEFGNRPQRFAATNRRIDEACEAIGRAPDSLWRSVEVYVQAPGARGLPVTLPEDFPIWGIDELSERLDELAALGAHLVQVLIDPQTPDAVEAVASAAAA
jgi:alkanesulfonate monooxygenase SsuD/methylene tetrahydromethanopterin reductase-like flavin-dependent oxidoreductase (luciferase family)